MAIKAELGEDGFLIWDEWSATSDKYRARDAARTWQSLKPSGSAMAGSVIHIARQYGYKGDHGNKPKPLTVDESARREAKRQADSEVLARRREAASSKAISIWNQAGMERGREQQAVADHPYLKRKRIQAQGAKIYLGNMNIHGMDCNGALMIPMRLNGKITSLQFINADGEKRFLPDGEKGGYLMGKVAPGKHVYICEGFATGASIREITSFTVLVAFDAGNLCKVSEILRAEHPEVLIIFCADDDPTGTGQRKATEAAQAVGGIVTIPEFGESRPDRATDFNDMALLAGTEAVRRVISAAAQKGQIDCEIKTKALSTGVNVQTVELLCASDLEPQPIAWLWDGWLAGGKVHILGGAPGTGKTTIAIGLAAMVTTGGYWPDGSRSPKGNVVIWSGEDDPADTLVPRLELAGADRSRAFFINAVREGNERRPFDPARDVEALQRKLGDVGGVRLLIIDPIVSAIAGDSHKNAEVRRGLQPLADLVSSTDCALLGITHFSKGTGGREPVERITGSLAFTAVPRVVMVAAKHQEESEVGDDKRLFLRAKSNIGRDDGGFEYQLKQAELKTVRGICASQAIWGKAVEGTARDLLAAADMNREENEGGALSNAKAFLLGILCRGPLPSKEVEFQATKASCSKATIRRAKDELGIKVWKEGGNFGGGKPRWMCALPASEGAQDAQDAPGDQPEQPEQHPNEPPSSPKAQDVRSNTMSTFSKNEHLQNDEDWVEEEI